MTLALLPVANGLDRYFDLFGEGRLRQPATRAHVAYELRRIAVVDRFFAAVRKDFDDPPVGFQPYPHHGRYPFDDELANELADSRPQFVNAEKGCYAGQDLGPIYRLASRLRPNSADPKRRDSATDEIVDRTKQDGEKDRDRHSRNTDQPPLRRWLEPERPQERPTRGRKTNR